MKECMSNFSQMQLAFWSELLSYNHLPKYLPILAEHQIALHLAVRPALWSRLGSIIETAKKLHLQLWLWPLLNWHEGYWVNSYNLDHHVRWVKRLVETFPSITGICLDLETPIHFRGYRGSLQLKQWNQTHSTSTVCHKLNLLTKWIQDQEKQVLSTSLPFNPSRQAKKGCPQPSNANLYSYMLYTSFLRPYLPNPMLDACVFYTAKKILSAFGRTKGAIDLGLTSYGVVNKKIHLANLEQITREVAICKAAGLQRIHIFALDNIAQTLSDWVTMLKNTAPQIPQIPIKPISRLIYRFFTKRLLSESLRVRYL